MNLLEEWNESDALTEYEKEILSKRLHHGENVETDWDNTPYNTRLEFRWQNIRTQYFDLMPNCGLDPDIWHLNFSTCCSNFIRELFNKHVDNNFTGEILIRVNSLKETLVSSISTGFKSFTFAPLLSDMPQ